MRGRRGTLGTSIDVRGGLATNWVGFGAARCCVAGVTLSAPQARFAWQAWYFRHLHRCPRKLGDELGWIWRRWILRGRRDTFSTSCRLDLRGRRGTFGTSIDVRGSLATNWVGFGAARCCVAGVALSAPQARCVWQAWYFRYLHRCLRKLGDELGRIWRRPMLRGRRGTLRTSASICVAGVVLSLPS